MNEVMTHATPWINLENMLRKQSQKATYYMVPFIKMYRTDKSLEIGLPEAEGMEVTVNGYRVSNMKKIFWI